MTLLYSSWAQCRVDVSVRHLNLTVRFRISAPPKFCSDPGPRPSRGRHFAPRAPPRPCQPCFQVYAIANLDKTSLKYLCATVWSMDFVYLATVGSILEPVRTVMQIFSDPAFFSDPRPRRGSRVFLRPATRATQRPCQP